MSLDWRFRPSEAQVQAAERLLAALKDAEEGNYLKDGWYSYMARRDVETVARAVGGTLL